MKFGIQKYNIWVSRNWTLSNTQKCLCPGAPGSDRSANSVRILLSSKGCIWIPRPPTCWPWMPISGDGKLHLTHFCTRSIIMQTAVNHGRSVFTTTYSLIISIQHVNMPGYVIVPMQSLSRRKIIHLITSNAIIAVRYYWMMFSMIWTEATFT